MRYLYHHLVTETARVHPANLALEYKDEALDYAALERGLTAVASGLLTLGLEAGERVAVWLPKRVETVLTMLGTSAAGGVFVPVNPVLKGRQAAHILGDCDVRLLVTSPERLRQLTDDAQLPDGLRHILVVDDEAPEHALASPWASLVAAHGDSAGDSEEPNERAGHSRVDADVAAILYTSGSTGLPKGVVLSHRNLLAGAESVATYLNNTPEDRILSVMTLSFDAGLSQLNTAFLVGATAVLLEYLLPRDVVRAVAKHRITGLAGVPPLWIQLATLAWPQEATESLRYITNTGGAMPVALVEQLRERLPTTDIVLMYGLTEAFRSTYLPPAELERRPGSMGKAVPNAEIMVVRPDGTSCDADEPGELVHRGALVSLGYWNDSERTAERFKPAPGQPAGLPNPELAVWSGDTVKRDADGYLYFVGRTDEMIKTSGYRVSPTEVEEALYATGLVGEAAAVGVPHPKLGQAIIVLVTGTDDGPAGDELAKALLTTCRRQLPNFMVPAKVEVRDALPRNPNGKIDRKTLQGPLMDTFTTNAGSRA